ncbi:MAG: serine hydrolase [Bacteroidia bacterium]|nr:serine hydrolase [Bacteroidia bacterium]
MLVILTQLTFGQTFNPIIASKLQTKLDSMKTAYNIKGISASLIYPGEGLWKGTTGLSYNSVPIHSNMEFGIASNSKLFTAVTLLKLAENNIIHIDDSLHQWIPTFPNINGNITIRQILNHTSGIADIINVIGYTDSITSNPNRLFNPNELITWVGTPLFPAGTSWNYSNTNYLLAGMIAESATGQNISQLIRKNILTPLQLDSTFFSVQESVLGTIAHPWQSGIDINNTPRTSLNSAAYSAGAIYSTSGNMAQWYQKLMSGQLLNASSFKQMTTFVGSGNYGLGLTLQVIGGKTCFAHVGTIRGYQSFMLYDTTSHAVVCVLINANPSPVKLVAEQLLLALNDFPLSVSEIPDYEYPISIYPNPATTSIQLDIPSNVNSKISISNNWGKRIFKATNQTQIDITDLPKGLYIITIETDKLIFTKKFIKN